MNVSRRNFIHTTGTVVAGLSLTSAANASELLLQGPKHPICLFSKHVQYLDFKEMSEILTEIGFDGIDLTVRKGGHIEPADVVNKLPKAIKAAQEEGLSIPMMTTNISDAEDKVSAKVLEVAADNGISHYRMGSIKYDQSMSIQKNLDLIKIRFEKLAVLNERFKIHGGFQNHWGKNFGAPVWDLYSVLKGINARWTGSQYDIRHATVEGGASWILGMKAIAPFIGSTVIKDMIWIQKNNKWRPQSVSLGTGMVDFDMYFEEYKKLPNAGPISLHYEYGLGGEKNRTEKNLGNQKIIDFYKTDLDTLKTMMLKKGIR